MPDQAPVSPSHAPYPPLPAHDWPFYGLCEDIYPVLRQWAEKKHRVILATLIETNGPSPRPLGSEMIINDKAEIAGYVSGGCVEAAVTAEAMACFADQKPRFLHYGAGSPALDIQLACGGSIGIFLRLIENLEEFLQLLAIARHNRQNLTIQTERATGKMRALPQAEAGSAPSPAFFNRSYPPCLHLVLLGGDPIILALMQLAPLMGIECRLLRPLGPPHPPENLTCLSYDRRPIIQILSDLTFDRWTALYCLSHQGETDQLLARHALQSPAFSVGILGSKSKIAQKLAYFRQEGVTEQQLQKLHLPAGLDIKARGPAEIALSILAEIITKRPREGWDKGLDYEELPSTTAADPKR